MISFANFFGNGMRPNYLMYPLGKTQLTMKLPKEYQTKLEASLQVWHSLCSSLTSPKAEVSKEGQKPKPLPEITTYSAVIFQILYL